MIKIDYITGAAVMRLWGIESWPDIDVSYFLWRDCGIFACIDFGSHVDLHMAMKKGVRHLCRDAVSEILKIIGDRIINAPILEDRKHVCNLAKKFGFIETFNGTADFIDGSSGGLIIMTRFPNGRNN